MGGVQESNLCYPPLQQRKKKRRIKSKKKKNNKNKKNEARLKFARELLNKDQDFWNDHDFWNNVRWTDESKNELSKHINRI